MKLKNSYFIIRKKILLNRLILLFLFFCFITVNCVAQIVYKDDVFPDVKIYEVSSEIFADVVVYKAPNSIYQGINKNEGIWFFSDNPSASNIKVGYVSSSIFADIKVYFTNSPIFSQWRNKEKRIWFAKKLKKYNN